LSAAAETELHLFCLGKPVSANVKNKRKDFCMEPKDYTVSRIEGEYAILREEKTGEELLIALALLPSGTDTGSRLHYEMPEYTLING